MGAEPSIQVSVGATEARSHFADMLKRVRAALLASIGENPGTYEGFEVAQRGGSRSVDYARLEEEYPEIYDEVVKIGAPTLVVKYGSE